MIVDRDLDLRHGGRPEEIRLPGITGVVRDGILPGLFGYEAGQPAVGDMLAWFVRTLGDGAHVRRPGAGGGRAGPGETGLVALDWFNGNRSILADADLTGVISGSRCARGRRRSTGRCWSRSRSATAGSWTTSPSTGSR